MFHFTDLQIGECVSSSELAAVHRAVLDIISYINIMIVITIIIGDLIILPCYNIT